MYEPATGGNVQDTFSAGFDTGPGGEKYNDRNALSYHIYCPPMQTDINVKPHTDKVETVCEKFNGWQIGVRGEDTKRLKTAGILSEFGAVDVSDPLSMKLMDFTMDQTDELLHSWTYWYMHVAEDGSNPDAKNMARTYARKTFGVVESMKFDTASADFKLTYVGNGAAGETEIFVSKQYNYPNGVNVSVAGGGDFVYDEAKGTVTVKQSSAAGETITVTITKQ